VIVLIIISVLLFALFILITKSYWELVVFYSYYLLGIVITIHGILKGIAKVKQFNDRNSYLSFIDNLIKNEKLVFRINSIIFKLLSFFILASCWPAVILFQKRNKTKQGINTSTSVISLENVDFVFSLTCLVFIFVIQLLIYTNILKHQFHIFFLWGLLIDIFVMAPILNTAFFRRMC